MKNTLKNKINKSLLHRLVILGVLCVMLFILATPLFANSTGRMPERLSLETHYDVVHFYSYWCSTCRKQQQSLDMIQKKGMFDHVQFKTVSMSSDLRKMYNVQHQSTILILRNNFEVARALGITSEKQIQDFLEENLVK